MVLRDESYTLSSGDSLTLHITGTVCARKRQYLLIEAINTLGRNFLTVNNVKLNVFGVGPDFNLLLAKVKEYGVKSLGDFAWKY